MNKEEAKKKVLHHPCTGYARTISRQDAEKKQLAAITAKSTREAFAYFCGMVEGFYLNGQRGALFTLEDANGKTIHTRRI